MDGEFPPLKHNLASTNINLNTAAFKEHVPQIERHTRGIEEQSQTTKHTILIIRNMDQRLSSQRWRLRQPHPKKHPVGHPI